MFYFKKPETKKEICEKCGTVDNFKISREGINKVGQSVLLLIFGSICSLIFLPIGAIIFVVGIVYISTQKSYRVFKVCASCNSENTGLDIETPKGKKLLEEFKKQE